MHYLQILCLIAGVSAGTISVPFSRASLDQNPSLVKRDTLTLDALNNITGGGYYGEFEVGTPGQKLSFLLDTGSSDTWVNSFDSDLCNSQTDQAYWGYCWNTFKFNASSTFEQSKAGDFQVKYLDGRNVQGDYFNDTITINGKAIKQQQLGLALNSSRATGIMGLGFKANVAAAVKYPTVLDNMVSQGYIETPVFSLYLNDLNASQGSILFGGIDQAKFYDKIVTLPLNNDFQAESQVTSFTISLQGLEVLGAKGYNFDSPIPNAILDSGSTLSLLPSRQAQPIHDLFGVVTIDGIRTPFVDCAWGGAKGQGYQFAFKFSGKTITVPMDEMVIDAFANVQEQIRNDPRYSRIFKDFSRICMFGIGNLASVVNSRDDIALLGDTFLRSAYVVYDLKNQQIGLAQAKLNSTETNIIEIKAGDKTIPNSKRGAGGRLTPAIVAAVFVALGATMALL